MTYFTDCCCAPIILQTGLGFGIGNTPLTCSTAISASSESRVFVGEEGVLYSVSIRVRGVFEKKKYIGGVNDGLYFQTDGAGEIGSYNVYRLLVSGVGAATRTSFFLNRCPEATGFCEAQVNAFDYTKNIQIKGGYTVRLEAFSQDGFQFFNRDHLVIPGIPNGNSLSSPMTAYAGQWVRIDLSAPIAAP